MKTKFLNHGINNYGLMNKSHNLRKEKTPLMNISAKNTNITRPAQELSFGGSVVSAAQQVAQKDLGAFGSKVVQNNKVNKLVDFVYDNEAMYNAIYSMLIAGIVKPLVVVNMPGSEEKDKQYIATKNFLQAFIGSFLGFTISGGVVKKAFDGVKNNLKLINVVNEKEMGKDGKEIVKSVHLEPVAKDSAQAQKVAKTVLKKEYFSMGQKFSRGAKAFKEAANGKFGAFFEAYKSKEYKVDEKTIANKAAQLVSNVKNKHLPIFEKNTAFVSTLLESAKDYKSDCTLMDAFESFWKGSSGIPVALTKAKISSFLLPTVMGVLFAKRTLKKQQEEQRKQQVTLLNSPSYQKDKEYFSSIINNDSSKENSNQVAFKGSLVNGAINGLTTGIEKLSVLKPFEAAVNFLHKMPGPLKKPSARMADIESFGITAYWVTNTLKSKKIPPSQKLGLNIHTVLVTAVSSITAFALDTLLDKPIKQLSNNYKNIVKNGVDSISKEAIKANDKATIQETIKEACKNLNNPKEIAKRLSEIDLADSKIVDKTITELGNGYQKKLSKFKSLTVFTLLVRFLVPVAMVKPGGKIKKKVIESREKKAAEVGKNKDNTKTA